MNGKQKWTWYARLFAVEKHRSGRFSTVRCWECPWRRQVEHRGNALGRAARIWKIGADHVRAFHWRSIIEQTERTA